MFKLNDERSVAMGNIEINLHKKGKIYTVYFLTVGKRKLNLQRG